jgi:hypothetical protein
LIAAIANSILCQLFFFFSFNFDLAIHDFEHKKEDSNSWQ